MDGLFSPRSQYEHHSTVSTAKDKIISCVKKLIGFFFGLRVGSVCVMNIETKEPQKMSKKRSQYRPLLSNKEVESATLPQPLFDKCAKVGADLERQWWSVEVFGGRLNSRSLWDRLQVLRLEGTICLLDLGITGRQRKWKPA